jgi:tRNA A-37 threonylcarbamoyl transferase component Bud32
VAKQRFTKRYRHPDLDAQLTKSRLQGVRAAAARRP